MDESRSERRAWVLAILAAAAIGAFYAANLRPGHNWGGDFSQYIRHAINLAEGRQYDDVRHIHNPHQIIAPTVYPPIFPALLIPVIQIFRMNWTAMKAENILFLMISLLATFAAFKDALPRAARLILILMIGLHPALFGFKENILSDIPFLLFTSLSVLLVSRRESEPRPLATGIAFYLAYATRSLGAVLPIALLFLDLLRHGRVKRTTLFTLGAFGALALAQLKFLPSGPSIIRLFKIDQNLILTNLYLGLREISLLWTVAFSKTVTIGVVTVMNGLALMGLLSRVRRGISFIEVFATLYFLSLLPWPYFQGIRFFFPILPVYFFYLLSGMLGLTAFLSKKACLAAWVACGAMTLTSYSSIYARLDYGPVHGIDKKESQELFGFVREKTSESDVILFFKPTVLALFTDRRASILHGSHDDQHRLRYISEIRAAYLVVSPGLSEEDRNQIEPMVQRNPEIFREVFHNSDFKVYRITGLW